MKTRYVVVNKTRFFLVICIFFLLILSLISVFMIPQKISSKNIDINYVYVVKDGDRLWDIASIVQSDEDIRQIIRNIRLANDISSDEFIYPGQKLDIPYEIKN